MFIVKQDQIEAFRIPMREAARDRLIADMASDELTVSADKSTLTQTDEYGHQTTLTYSADVLPVAITKPSGVQYGLSYDSEGRLSSVEYPDGSQLQVKFADGQLQQVSASPDKQYQFDYKKGLLSRIVYPGQKSQQFIYNDFGDLLALTDRTGQTTEYVRTSDGQLQAIKDPLNRAFQFRYDEQGLLSDLIFPDETKQSYLYDEEADALYVRLRDGKGFSQQYDGDTITELAWENGPVTRFSYDAQQQPTRIDTDAVAVAFTYDNQQRLSTEQGPHGLTTFAYDRTARLTRLLLATGTTVDYEYDADSRVTALHIHGQTVRFVYDEQDLLAEIQYPNGLTEYQRRSHTTGLHGVQTKRASGETLTEQAYGYDAWDRLTHYQDTATQQTLRLTYDDESRLTGVGDDRARRYLERFTYDAKGNLDQHNGRQVWVGHMDEIRRIGSQSISYDGLGNITRLAGPKGDIHCQFARNSTLTSVRIGDSNWRYEYDGIGRRTSKTDGIQTWQYGWAGSQLVVETFRRTPTAVPLVREYVYLPDSQAPVAFYEAGRLCWMQADVRGAITYVFDEAGTVVWQARYSAFGEITILHAQVRQPWRLMGQYEDDETGLYYNLARYYAPWLTTYLSLDPEWSDPDTYHYSYARNDPYNRADPLGNIAPLIIAGLVGAAVGGVISGVTKAIEDGSAKEILGAAAHGALSGAGAAVGGIVGFAIGGPWGAYAGMVAGTGTGGFFGSLAEQAINGDNVFSKCALQKAVGEALGEMAFAAALGVLGKVLGPALRPLGRWAAKTKTGSVVLSRLKAAVASVKQLIRKAKTQYDPTYKPFLESVEGFAESQNAELADKAHTLWKKGKWKELEDLFKSNNLNGGWPPNGGFIKVNKITLSKGKIIDRFGKESGTYTAPDGTPITDRALKPGTSTNQPFNRYRVLKNLPEVKAGESIPWFGERGGGVQYELPDSIEDLIKAGYLERIN